MHRRLYKHRHANQQSNPAGIRFWVINRRNQGSSRRIDLAKVENKMEWLDSCQHVRLGIWSNDCSRISSLSFEFGYQPVIRRNSYRTFSMGHFKTLPSKGLLVDNCQCYREFCNIELHSVRVYFLDDGGEFYCFHYCRIFHRYNDKRSFIVANKFVMTRRITAPNKACTGRGYRPKIHSAICQAWCDDI